MGCCACRPKTEVTEDPDVIMYTRTGGAALIYPIFSEPLTGMFGNGLLYVKDGMLFQETTCGSKLYCECFKKSWDLSAIQSVEYVENDSVVLTTGRTVQVLTMKPGLKIKLVGDAMLVAHIPDAENFKTQLDEHLSRRAGH